MGAHESRLLVDALYGLQALDHFLAELIEQPEIQRLRDVRLSNINSAALPGAANISRFEHSVGTALLAGRTAKALELNNADRHKLVLAALLHDVAITPYGHLMEEGFAYAGKSYDHEGRLLQIFQGRAEHGTIDYQILRGQSVGFRRILAKRPYRSLGIEPAEVMQIIRGGGHLGPLVNASIDLDNIDNVCRMAYHIGIPYRRALPCDLTQIFTLRGNTVYLRGDKVDAINEWMHLRFRLYSALMTNPTDFAAKAMIVEAVRVGLLGAGGVAPMLSEGDWSLTDSDFIQKLASSKLTAGLIRRFETGNLFAVVGLYWVDAERFKAAYPHIPAACMSLRQEVAAKSQVGEENVLFYGIRDKRIRRIPADKWVGLDGSFRPPDRSAGQEKYLIGCVAGKVSHVGKLRKALITEIESRFGVNAYEPCDSDGILQSVFDNCNTQSDSQGSLF